MAELTPPPSEHNTPLRLSVADQDSKRSNLEAPGSPTMSGASRPHPDLARIIDLSTAEGGGSHGDTMWSGEIDSAERMVYGSEGEEGDSSGSEDGDEVDDRMQVVGEGEGGEEEGEIIQMEEVEGNDDEASKGVEAGAVPVEGGAKVVGAKRKARPTRAKNPKGKGKAPATPGGGRATRSGAGPKARKDGELYETEIVNRWNFEFGDPCNLRPPLL